jgi:hypothetical protein
MSYCLMPVEGLVGSSIFVSKMTELSLGWELMVCCENDEL